MSAYAPMRIWHNPAEHMTRRTITCKFCGQTGLIWDREAERWRLKDGDEFHHCERWNQYTLAVRNGEVAAARAWVPNPLPVEKAPKWAQQVASWLEMNRENTPKVAYTMPSLETGSLTVVSVHYRMEGRFIHFCDSLGLAAVSQDDHNYIYKVWLPNGR